MKRKEKGRMTLVALIISIVNFKEIRHSERDFPTATVNFKSTCIISVAIIIKTGQ